MQGMHYYGGAVASDPREKSKGWLTAFDASTGKERWKYASPTPLVAGVTATSGGVLFTGDLNNDFLALDAKTGDVLYRFNTGGSIGGGVITYALDGKQYVAATSGTVSAFFGGSGLPAVVVFAEGPRTVQTALKPLDPDQAPVAAVDRFSEKAAHLQVRTADNKIPGPNEPVDFDTGPFITQGLSPTTGKPVRYYNFDVQGTTSAPVYVLYREGEDKPVDGQLDIIDTLPGEKGYNDFRQVWKVTVPKDYVANIDHRRGHAARRGLQDGTDRHAAQHAGRARQVESEHAPRTAKAPSCNAPGTKARWRSSSASVKRR